MANYGILPQQYNGTTYDTLYFKNNLSGTTAPTTSTVAYYVGQLYINTTNGDMYKCIAISGSTYTWQPITNQSIITDYIVDIGASGIWTYRKWVSGIAECWSTVTYSNAQITTPVDGKYYWENARISYPTGLFISKPIEFPTLMPVYNAQWGTPAANTTNETGVYGIWSDTPQTVNLQINFSITGAWK